MFTVTESLSILLVLVGIGALVRSYFRVTSIISMLEPGTSRRRWQFLSIQLVFFIVSFALFLPINHFYTYSKALPYLVVPVIFFFGAIFALVVTQLSAQTIGSLRKMIAIEEENKFLRREHQSAEKLSASMAFSEALMQSMPGVVCIFDSAGSPKRWNRNFLGYTEKEVLESGVLATVSSESQDAVQHALINTFETGAGATEAWLMKKDGTKVPSFLQGVRIMFEGAPCLLGIALDISKQKQAEEQIRLQSAALNSAANSIYITSADGTIQWVNAALSRLTGYDAEELIGRNPRIWKSDRQNQNFYKDLWGTILKGELWKGEITNLTRNGTIYIEEMTISPVRSTAGEITHFVAIVQDITERRRIEEEVLEAKERAENANRELLLANGMIERLARIDALTGLANRRALDEKLQVEMARTERQRGSLSLIIADLDHFKSINDKFGHQVGDQVLANVASAFGPALRPYDLAARYGGEEFVLLLPETPTSEAAAAAERIRGAVQALKFPACPKTITISLGVSTWNQTESPDQFIDRADGALYTAKRKGRNRVEVAWEPIEVNPP